MKEAFIELWDLCGRVDVICITTNGAVRKDGACVMGRGCAAQAKSMFPGIDEYLGAQIKIRGNVPSFLGFVDRERRWTPALTPDLRKTPGISELWSFPVKHVWNQKADVELIRYSAHLLREAMGDRDVEVVIPRPGCGNGGLEWKDVALVLATQLDNRFTIVTNTVATSG